MKRASMICGERKGKVFVIHVIVVRHGSLFVCPKPSDRLELAR